VAARTHDLALCDLFEQTFLGKAEHPTDVLELFTVNVIKVHATRRELPPTINARLVLEGVNSSPSRLGPGHGICPGSLPLSLNRSVLSLIRSVVLHYHRVLTPSFAVLCLILSIPPTVNSMIFPVTLKTPRALLAPTRVELVKGLRRSALRAGL
jgi:hypothetical protein